MLLKLYDSFSLDLANISMITMPATLPVNPDEVIQIKIGPTEVMGFHSDRAQKLKDAIADYNKQGGRYHWLFGDVVINLDKVTAVYHVTGHKRIDVYCPEGKWSSLAGLEHSQTSYDLYLKAAGLPQTATASEAATSGQSKTSGKKSVANSDKMTAAQADIDRMIGCDRAKRELRENLAYARLDQAKRAMKIPCEPMSRHMAFLGNPGTGKTSFARKIAKLYHAAGIIREDKVIEKKRVDLVGEYIGHTAKLTAKAIEEAKGGILFIDEAYDLLRNEQGGGSRDFGQEAVNTLVPAMEDNRDDLLVIFAGYHDDMLKMLSMNRGLASRCSNIVVFEDYTLPEMELIMNQMLQDRGLSISEEAKKDAMKLLEENKRDTPVRDFGNARTVRNLIEKAERALALRLDAAGEIPEANAKLEPGEMTTRLTLQPADIAGITLDQPDPVDDEQLDSKVVHFPTGLGKKARSPFTT